jgi:hypothetical protein
MQHDWTGAPVTETVADSHGLLLHSERLIPTRSIYPIFNTTYGVPSQGEEVSTHHLARQGLRIGLLSYAYEPMTGHWRQGGSGSLSLFLSF